MADMDLKNKVAEKLKSVLEELYRRNGKNNPDKLSESAYNSMVDCTELSDECNIEVRMIKGGTYKIKGYYLENNKLPDIRGASAVITEVQEKIVPDMLRKELGFDFILYNGGGNLMALVPENCSEELVFKIEKESQRYLVTANSAYMLSECFTLREFLGTGYKKCVSEKENKLNERKKAKIMFEISPASDFLNKNFLGITLSAYQKQGNSSEYCERCCKRIARYVTDTNIKICGGCLHKYIVGKDQKSKYIRECKKVCGYELETVKSLKDIGFGKPDHVAVLYADGNNMGGIIQNFKNICDMMEFSLFVKQKMPEIVYNVLRERQVSRCEIVALGGDDVFIIVPGKKAVRLAAEMIKKYDEEFARQYPKANSTLSAGLCIAKSDTPVKVMLEMAENELDKAKGIVKKQKIEKDAKAQGSLSYIILDTYEGGGSDSCLNVSKNDYEFHRSLRPFMLSDFNEILKYKKTLFEAAKSRLRNIADAFINSDSYNEASCFFEYLNAKARNDERIKLIEMSGFEIDRKNAGFYINKKNKEYYCIWEDILDLMDYSE